VSRPRLDGFRFGDEWRNLKNPTGPPTWRQLLRLNALGCLELVPPGESQPITKAEAAYALNDAQPDDQPPGNPADASAKRTWGVV